MSAIEQMAADVVPPTSDTIEVLEVTTASQNLVLPAALALQAIYTLQADGAKVGYVLTNDPARTVSLSSLTQTTACARLADGQDRDMKLGEYVGTVWTPYARIALIGSAAGILRIFRSSPAL